MESITKGMYGGLGRAGQTLTLTQSVEKESVCWNK